VTASRAGSPSGRTYLLFSVFEAVAEFGEDLAGVVVVEAAEGEAVVEENAAVGYVGCGDGGG
jgi:hypothetical protein